MKNYTNMKSTVIYSNEFNSNFDKLVKNICSKGIVNPIIIVSGLFDYVDFSLYKEYIADIDTFNKEGDETLFNREWVGKIFGVIFSAPSYRIVSRQQYEYIAESMPDFFKDKTFHIYDNLRTLYPLAKENYIETTDINGMENRPDNMPIYQIEQIKVASQYFYSLRNLINVTEQFPFFTQTKKIEYSNFDYTNDDVVDVTSNPYAIDLFINKCILSDNFNNKFVVKTFNKFPFNITVSKNLEYANYLLSLFGGGIFYKRENAIDSGYIPSDDALRLLQQYWGEQANFRSLKVYEDPDTSNVITEISQGKIVDTIINEYKIGKNNKTPRDIFITAPTGAGKSLIFQLPAFYAAEHGDMTIVVSPLKALMTDQVNNLITERNYKKVAYINSDLNFIDRDILISKCKNGEIDILYLSPESLLSYDIHYFIGQRKLGLLIIDEAHLITTWGRDFRVDYWFLGNHINKIRKYGNYYFPLVALTATAVYSGTNDMVFDSISSLYMHDPYKFIGEVKRNDIEFIIDNHDDYTSGAYDLNKERETLNFIDGVKNIDCKTIVYAPYTKHIDRIASAANAVSDSVVSYHGGMNSDEQKGMYSAFRNNLCKIMVCTKAFGMGIDIPDIQCVYHHAPSGLLPDYIQEIGRVARDKNLKGFAALTFSPADLRYSKQLFGISSIKDFQLRNVLKKVYNLFEANNKKRNMLVAANDFAYIFNRNDDVSQKVQTALMMIEKDYLAKTRFNVLIARPKSLFSKVFARITDVGLSKLQTLYPDSFSNLNINFGEYHFIQLDLDKIWAEHFSDVSFPKIKKDFYDCKFLYNQGIEITPLLKITYMTDKSFIDINKNISYVLDKISAVLLDLHYQNKFFTENKFKELLKVYIDNEVIVDKLTSFILSSYSEKLINGHIEGDAFLQRRIVGAREEYQILNPNYNAKISQLKKKLHDIFGRQESKIIRYVSIKEVSLENYLRVGALIEILDMGTFTSQGGEDPKIFIRINDPRRIKKDSEDLNYKNNILNSVINRHKTSCEIFEHFFTQYFDNTTRWNIIEDFFLGISSDELIVKYPGGTKNRVDIIKYLTDNITYVNNIDTEKKIQEFKQEFQIRKGGYYNSDSLLTIENRTFTISQWLTNDPVLLHRTIIANNIHIEKEYYKVLMSRLQCSHFPYYRDFMGLKLHINFPNNPGIPASVPYNNNPVDFYKWWKQNPDKVTLNKHELRTLFFNVERLNPKALLKKHRDMLI